MAEKLEFDLTVKSNTLKTGLEDAISKSGKLEGALNTALGVFGGGLAIKALDSFGRALGNTVEFAKDSVKAFSEQEDAINRLGQSLRASGEFSNSAIEDFSRFATELQRTSKFGDEVVLSQLALAKSFGASNSEAKNLVTAAANLSATFGGSLEDNLEKLGKTLSGTAGRLAQFIPELKTLTAEQLRSADAADIINSKFGGAAAAELNTYSGSVAAAGNAFSDLQEELGRLLAKNDLTKGFISGITSGFQGATTVLKNFTDALGVGLSPIDEQRNKLKELGEEYNKLEDSINSTKKNIDFSQKSGSEELANVERIQKLQAQIVVYESQQNEILSQRKDIRSALASDKASSEIEKPKSIVDDQAVKDAKLALNNELTKIDEDYKNQKLVSEENDKIAELEALGISGEEKILILAEQKLRENELIYKAETDKNELIKNFGEKELANKKALAAKILADEKINSQKELDLKKNLAIQEKAVFNSRIAAASAFLNLGEALSKQGSTSAKALASANAVLATYAGANQVLKDPTIPVLAKPAFIAATVATGLANVARINGVQFEQGGFVGGMNGASIGPDNTTATIRTGEFVLNGEDQLVMLNAIKSGSFGGGDIVVQIDGREILRAVRNQLKQGARL